MAPFVTLEATTKRLRNEAIPGALAALGAEGGFVTATHPFGGLALSFQLELPSDAARTLDGRLAAEGIRLDEKSRASLEAAAGTGKGLVGSLLLRFLADEPDLAIEIPKVPGE